GDRLDQCLEPSQRRLGNGSRRLPAPQGGPLKTFQVSLYTATVKVEGTPMKIVVIGGTGLIGSKVVANLREKGHEVVAAAPSSGVNTITGEGLSEALTGAQVVVDVANAP